MSVEMAANMAADGIPIEKIAQYLKVDTTTVKKWLDKKIWFYHKIATHIVL